MTHKYQPGDIVRLLHWDEIVRRYRGTYPPVKELEKNGDVYVDGTWSLLDQKELYGKEVIITKVLSVKRQSPCYEVICNKGKYNERRILISESAIDDTPAINCPSPAISFDELFTQS